MDNSLCKKNYDIFTKCIKDDGAFTQFSLLNLFMTSGCGRLQWSIEKLILSQNEDLALGADIKIMDKTIKVPIIFDKGYIDYLAVESVSFFNFSWLESVTFYIDAINLYKITCDALYEFFSVIQYNPLVAAANIATCLFTLDDEDQTFKISLGNRIVIDKYTKSKLSSMKIVLEFKRDIK